jgi:hypothetical protein
MKFVRGALFVLAAIQLQGCGDIKRQFADRYGPAPVLDDTTVSDAAMREASVVRTFMEASGYAGQKSLTPDDWYAVMLTGFNTIDDACQTYINDLWKLDREKGRIKDILTATGAATGAIVAANAHPSTATLSVLTQAFGLAGALTGAVADSYLYAQDPATIGMLVKKLQVAYRDDLAKNLNTKGYPISSYAAVYFHTREYLSLCLPPTIQAQIAGVLAKSQARPDSATTPPNTPTKKTAVSAPSVKSTKGASSISLNPS